jgi:hypothetical protein
VPTLYFYRRQADIPASATILTSQNFNAAIAGFEERFIETLAASPAMLIGWRAVVPGGCEVVFLGDGWTDAEKAQGRSRVDQGPVSISDVEKSPEAFDMHLALTDPCPECGRSMRVGDWVCWGMCYGCFKPKEKQENERKVRG